MKNRLSKSLWILLLPSIVFIMCISICIESAPAQSVENDEIIATVRPISPITADLTPNEFKFETNYRLSRYYRNEYPEDLLLNISQGIVSFTFGDYAIPNVTIFDNLGNDFDPVFENNTVLNPKAEVVLPPSFEYKLSLSFDTDQDIHFDSRNTEYLLEGGYFKNPRPATLTVRFPNNFTVLQCTSLVNQSEENDLLVLKWAIKSNEEFHLFVRFLPFRIQGEVKSFKFVLDIPTVFPVKGFIRGSVQEALTTPATFSIWKINPVLTVPVGFPEYAEHLKVEEVWDGMGACQPIAKPAKRVDNSSLGYYHVDYENREVIVYPRYHYKLDTYEYIVGVTFETPPEYEPYKMEAIRDDQWLPFRYESFFIIDKVLAPTDWKLDITGNVEVEFLLPRGAEPLKSESGNPTIGLEGDRPVARFIYNSPRTLSPTAWHVVYDIVALRTFFYIEIVSLISLLFISTVVSIFNLPSGLIIAFIPLSSSLVIFNANYFISLGGSKPLLVLLFAIEVVLFLVIITASVWKLQGKGFSIRILIARIRSTRA